MSWSGKGVMDKAFRQFVRKARRANRVRARGLNRGRIMRTFLFGSGK